MVDITRVLLFVCDRFQFLQCFLLTLYSLNQGFEMFGITLPLQILLLKFLDTCFGATDLLLKSHLWVAGHHRLQVVLLFFEALGNKFVLLGICALLELLLVPVSYTHLTLPTILRV